MADIEKINPTEIVPAELINDLRKIIDSARSHVAATANYELTAMYWHIGDRINSDVLNNARAEYSKQIVATVARQLSWSHFLIVMPMKTSPESALRSISPNCHQRKFSFANCKNPLRLPKIYTPTDDREKACPFCGKRRYNLNVEKKK